MRALAFLIIFLMFSHIAKADDWCSEAINTIDRNECMQSMLHKADGHLNTTYKKAIASLSKPDDGLQKYSEIKRSLVAAQRAWISFRQKDCDAESSTLMPPDSTAGPALHMHCMIEHATLRTKRIQELYFDNNPNPSIKRDAALTRTAPYVKR